MTQGLRIRLRVQELARTKGIESSTQLETACGLNSPSTAAKAWFGRGGLSMETIQSLCDGLECMPGELFDYVPLKARKAGIATKTIPALRKAKEVTARKPRTIKVDKRKVK